MYRLSTLLQIGFLSLAFTGATLLASSPEDTRATPFNGQFVPAKEMEARCITMVSPDNRMTAPGNEPFFVVVHARVLRTGVVVPLYVLSGPTGSRNAAINAVRQWMYRPYRSEQTLIEVVTDIPVPFIPGQPGGMISHPHTELR